MKIKKHSGHVVYSPLSYVFQILEMGGSALQKYDATTSSYIPNRQATPLVLQPSLIVSDPDGVLNTADYVGSLVNVNWQVTSRTERGESIIIPGGGNNVNYVVDNATHRLTFRMNVEPGAVVHVKFTADFIDNRRQEVHNLLWECDLGCEAQTDMNVTLDTGRWRRSVSLVPMKHWGQFGIPVQLMNGKDPVPDARAVYQWQWWNENTHTWSEDFSEQPWLVSGEQTKEIVVDQDYIQTVVLRVKATAFGNNATTQYWVTRLRRWYGQFDYDVEFLQGKYIFHDSKKVVLNAWVANAKGQIQNPCKYFDIELFFAIGAGGFESVGYGTEVIIQRNDLQSGQPRIGMLCRELSAFRAIAEDDGSVICLDDGTPIFAQFPTKSRETT